MGDLQSPTSVDSLAAQLEAPTAREIWSRALEVFGDETKARSWMQTSREIFEGRSPEQIIASGDVAGQRRILEVLLRIDYGVFS